LVLLATGLLGAAGYVAHGTYNRLVVAVTGGLIRMVEPGEDSTRLTSVPGGAQVKPAYAGADRFFVNTRTMHLSAPLVLALLLVGGPGRIGLARRLTRLLIGGALVVAGHMAALIAQLEFSPLLAAGFREPVYYVYRFFWWVGTVWGMLVLPAGAALFVYLADFREAGNVRRRVRARAVLLALGWMAGVVMVLAWSLAHLRPELPVKLVAESPRRDAGVEAFRAGRYAEAVEAFRARLQDETGNAALRYNLGVSLYRTGRFAEAMQELSLVRSQEPDHPGLDVSLGAVLFALGEREEALQAFQRADLAQVTDADLLVQVGGVMFGAGDREGAERAYRRALAVRPTHAEASYRLGILIMAGGQREEAVLQFQQAIAARPDYLEAYKYLAVAHQQAGRNQPALDAYAQALRLAPDDLGALFGVASILLRSDDPCRARPYLSRCAQAPGGEQDRQRCRGLAEQMESTCPG
jgi:tetratricopeptide (TPR) repeat protein